jgi:proteasome lid subunit RPN8/RPN11
MVAHVYAGLPNEACGLFAARPGSSKVEAFYPCRNADESARTYTIDPADHLRADRQAEDRGLEIVGVMHSHTHTEPYPSPTDVEKAEALGDWHFVIVSLRRGEPELRCYRIVGGNISEEEVVPLTR